MALISLIDVCKSFDADSPLLRGVSLTVGESDRLGLIGSNGCGKSTLLRLLTGELEPESGKVVRSSGLRIGYLEQEPKFDFQETIKETVRKGFVGRKELLAELDELHDSLAHPDLASEVLGRLLRRQEQLQARLDDLGGTDVEHVVEATIHGVGLLDSGARCGELSGGEVRRVALAQLLVSQPDIFLLDEPTNHLDTFVIAWLEERLRLIKAPLVLVTHDRYLLDRIVDRIVEIDQGKVYHYSGGYSSYVEQRAARLEVDAKNERSRLLLLRRETAWMRRGPKARSTKAKARIERYEELVNDEPEERSNDLSMRFVMGRRLGNRVLEVKGLQHALGERVVLPSLDLEITPGMRLGIVGPNGAGKTTLLRILLGKLQPDQGTIELGETVEFSIVDQRRSDLDPEKTVVEEVAGEGAFVLVGTERISVASFLNQFLFPGPKKHVLIGKLSGGERGRVVLAKLLLSGGNVLVLDEPTNDLDLSTLRALEEAMLAFQGVVIVVSHDRWFLDRVATQILHLGGPEGPQMHHGSMSELLDKLASQPDKRRKTKRETGGSVSTPPRPSSKPKRLSNWERTELEELTQRISSLESDIVRLDGALSQPDLYRSGNEKALALTSEREEVEQALMSAMLRWEELAERE